MKIRSLLIFSLIIIFAFQTIAQEMKKAQVKKKPLKTQQRMVADVSHRIQIQLEPGEQVISVPAAAFLNEYPNMSQWSNHGDMVHNPGTGGSHHYVAPLYLPHGARVARIAFICYDNDERVSPSLWLMRKADYIPPEEGPRTDLLASVSTSGAFDGYRMSMNDNIREIVIDNLTGTYYLQLNLGKEYKFRSAKVFYTIE